MSASGTPPLILQPSKEQLPDGAPVSYGATGLRIYAPARWDVPSQTYQPDDRPWKLVRLHPEGGHTESSFGTWQAADDAAKAVWPEHFERWAAYYLKNGETIPEARP